MSLGLDPLGLEPLGTAAQAGGAAPPVEPPVDPPARHAVAGADSSSASTSTAGAIVQRHRPAGAASSSTSTSSSGQLVQHFKLAGASSTSSGTSSAGAVASEAAPAVAGAPTSSAGTSSSGQLAQRHKLAGASSSSASTSSSAAVSIQSDPRYARPEMVASPGSWTPSAGDSLAAMLTEPTPDASTYIQATAPGSCEIALNPVQDPGTSTGQVVRYQAWSPTGSGVTVRLKQGATVIASWVHLELPPEPTIYAQALTPQQCDAINNYADLRFVFEAA